MSDFHSNPRDRNAQAFSSAPYTVDVLPNAVLTGTAAHNGKSGLFSEAFASSTTAVRPAARLARTPRLPRLLTRTEAVQYLSGIQPEAIGVRPVPAHSKKRRYDQRHLDLALDQLSGIEPVREASAPMESADAALEEWIRG